MEISELSDKSPTEVSSSLLRIFSLISSGKEMNNLSSYASHKPIR